MTDQWIVWLIQGAFAAVMMGLSAAIAFILKVVWEGLREAQKADIDQYREITKLQLHVSDNYVKREILKEELKPIKSKVDQIFAALWQVTDRRGAHPQQEGDEG